MTELEWIVSTDPAAMLRLLASIKDDLSGPFWRRSDRKLRLFACACCRLLGVAEGEPVAACEEWADGGPAVKGRWVCADPDVRKAAGHVVALRFGLRFGPERDLQPDKAALLRDVVGNPFRPVRAALYDNPGCPNREARHPGFVCTCPPWLTPTVLSLAHAAYDERLDTGALDPVRLSILADAMEDAGCSDAFLLRHLRGEQPVLMEVGGSTPVFLVAGWEPLKGPHVRGCHAVDLCLGRS